jgi:protein O-mannosyl-transferase
MRRDWQIMAVLAVATVAVFWPVSRHEFVNYDDPAYVSYNAVVQQGVTWPGVKWAFSELHGEATYWHPVTWLSHMLDCQIFGLRPAGHHLSSLVLHTLNALLLFALLRRTTGRRGASAMVAALFALHPLQVDSVAWIAERKNVLSTLFGLLCLWSYVKYVEESKGLSLKSKVETGATFHVSHFTFHVFRFYALSLLFFALGLMSKPMLVTLPLVMLWLDYWPLKRIAECGLRSAESGATRGRPRSAPHVSRFTFHIALRLLAEKVPFLALSLGSSLVTIRAHAALGALMSAEALPVPYRLANAVVACALYLRKLAWPVDLSVFYLHPGRWPAETVVGSTLLLLGVTALAVWQRRRRPYLIAGWLWFLVMLLPVIGLVQAHVQAMADRFAYLPAIGIFVMVVWAAADWLAGRREGWFLAALVLAGCVVGTELQLRHWRNSLTLLQRAVEVEPGNSVARVMLGNAFLERRQFEGALREFQAATRLRPDYPDAWVRAGTVLIEQGKPADALPYLLQAAQLAPGWPEVQRRLGQALMRQGRRAEARAVYQNLARMMPATAEARRDLADMLGEGEQFAEAVQYYQEALRLKPDFAPVLNNLALLRASCPEAEFRNGPGAVQLAETACRLTQRRDPSFLGTLAAAYAEAGRFPDAIRTIQEAMSVAKASGASAFLPSQAKMLEQFRAGKPYRQS